MLFVSTSRRWSMTCRPRGGDSFRKSTAIERRSWPVSRRSPMASRLVHVRVGSYALRARLDRASHAEARCRGALSLRLNCSVASAHRPRDAPEDDGDSAHHHTEQQELLPASPVTWARRHATTAWRGIGADAFGQAAFEVEEIVDGRIGTIGIRCVVDSRDNGIARRCSCLIGHRGE